MQWFKNRKTLTKLMLAFSLMSVFMGVIGYEGLSAANSIHELLATLYERDVSGMMAIKEAQLSVVRIGREARAVLVSTDATQKQDLMRTVGDEFKAVDEYLTATEKTLVTEEGKAVLAGVRKMRPQFETSVNEMLRLAALNKTEEARAKLLEVTTLESSFRSEMRRIVEMKEKLSKKGYDQSAAEYAHVRTTLIAVLLTGVLLALAFGYFIAQLIAKPLVATVDTLGKVADGDFTVSVEVDTKDEVGEMAEALNRTIEEMRRALTEVRNSAESMASSSQELASASEELSSGAQEQASSLEETTATLEEITSAVKQNADNAKQASQVASGSRDTAEKGGHVVADAVTAMGEINEASKNIAEIITTIDEIAFQTNLLALNAAVEAARAGEQGRGFAVVATEVRNLAQRSASSAKEIKRLIQDSVRKVENGSGLVNQSGETLHQIIDSVKRVTDIVAEIAAASREQSTGIEQVNKAMVQMDQVTQVNSSQTEELSATAQNLATHAEQLQALVGRFKVDAKGVRQSFSAAVPATVPVKPVVAAPASKKPVAKAPAAKAGGHGDTHALVASAHKIKPNGHDTTDVNAFIEF